MLEELPFNDIGSPAFHQFHDVSGRQMRRAIDKQVAVIHLTFHGKDFHTILPADLVHQLFEPVFQTIDEEYLSSIARAKHKMVVAHGYRCTDPTIRTIHITVHELAVNNKRPFLLTQFG